MNLAKISDKKNIINRPNSPPHKTKPLRLHTLVIHEQKGDILMIELEPKIPKPSKPSPNRQKKQGFDVKKGEQTKLPTKREPNHVS